MRININFLQTGGVPLTNDLMAQIMDAISTYNVLGDLAGNLTILSGCVQTGQNISPGVVVVDGDVLYFEGGTLVSTVYVHTEEITKTFQDTADKVLIIKKTVRFGSGAIDYNWADFFRLETLKEIQQKVNNGVTLQQFNDLKARVELLELKTAPVINGGIVWAWFKPASEIPVGWKECLDTRGKTIVGLDPNDSDFSTLKTNLGAKTHTLTSAQLPKLNGKVFTIAPDWDFGSGVISATNANKAFIVGGNSSYFHKEIKIEFGNGEAHNNIQPSIIANFIEPNFQ